MVAQLLHDLQNRENNNSAIILLDFNKLPVVGKNNSIFRATFLVILANEGHSSKLKNNKIV